MNLKKPALTASQSHRGQGALIAVAITLLVAMVLGATALTGLSGMNAQRTMVTRQTLQTYYVAQAGIQEALATRMVPRSNFLNFSPPANISPYLNQSGLVYQDPKNQRGLIGVYRYLIVGGDPSRPKDGSYYGIPAGSPPYAMGTNTTQNAANPIPRLVTFQTSPPDSPFYVISNGLTCKSPQGRVDPDQFVNAPTTNPAAIGVTPRCQGKYILDEVTLVSRINLEPETSGRDRLNQSVVFPNRKSITLPTSAFIPGSGWKNTLDFDAAWQHSTTTSSPARLTRIVFFDFGPNRVYQSVDLTANATKTTIAKPIPISASMMLYFDGPIDYRSLSNRLSGPLNLSTYYDKDLGACKVSGGATNVNNCSIQLFETFTAKQYTGMTIVPIMPYLTKVLLLAPIGNSVKNGTAYEIRVRQDLIRSFSQAPGGTSTAPYTIAFTTCKPGDPSPCP